MSFMQKTLTRQRSYPNRNALRPLNTPIFCRLWGATIVLNTGLLMTQAGAAWLMTTLTESPLLVALVQSAAYLPAAVLALLGGILADTHDRRRYIITMHASIFMVIAFLALSTHYHAVTPPVLLFLVFALGCAVAMATPGWKATIPELVPPRDMPAAVALNVVGFNVSRAIGPALAGAILAAYSPAAVFAVAAVAALLVIAAFHSWRRSPGNRTAPKGWFLEATLAGFRYLRESSPMQVLLIRSAVFYFSASATWALLPLVARSQLGLGPGEFGLLFGLLGLGAVLGALVLPLVRAHAGPDPVIAGATVGFAATTLLLAFSDSFLASCIATVLAGAFWIAALSTLNIVAQTIAPAWARARALALPLMVFSISMAAGSAFWGEVASRTGILMTLLAASVGLLLGVLTIRRLPLPCRVADEPQR